MKSRCVKTNYSVLAKSFIRPPKALLEVITEWIQEYRTLCLTALLVNLQPALPLGGIPMPAVTPFAGLMKYVFCVCVFVLTSRQTN